MSRLINTLGVISLISICSVGLAHEHVNWSSVNKQGKSIAERVRPHLPIKSGGTLTLIDVTEASGLLVYEHTFDQVFAPENEPIIKDWLNGQGYKSACSVKDLVKYIDSGGALHYRFFYNGNFLHSVKIERC